LKISEEQNESTCVQNEDEPEISAKAEEAIAPDSIDSAIIKAVCEICKEEFDSRNKLFAHIKEQGHARLKSEPAKENKAKKSKSKKK
jgi:DnaJ family protein A protein 5